MELFQPGLLRSANEGTVAADVQSRYGSDGYSTLPIFFTAAIRRALSDSTNFANSGAS
jgi:hypothetical protein